MVDALLDTNILIDILRGYNPAVKWIRSQDNLGITRIVYLELVAGAPNQAKQNDAITLLSDFRLVEMIDSDFEWATIQLLGYRLSHNIGILDCLIAAPSYRLNLPLYTRNLNHISPLLDTLVHQPY